MTSASDDPVAQAGVPLVLAAVLAGCAGPPSAAPDAPAEPIAPTDLVWLESEQLALAASPGLGRITWFGPDRQTNLLWLNDTQTLAADAQKDKRYLNYGGDKVWPTLQAMWLRAFGHNNWPPDGVIDGSPHELVEANDTRIVTRSATHPTLGVQLERRVELVEGGEAVRIVNVLTRRERSVFPVHVWTVTQARPPEAMLLGVLADKPDSVPLVVGFGKVKEQRAEARAHARALVDDTVVCWTPRGERGLKIGTMGDWIAGVYADHVFVQTFEARSAGAYPDGASVHAYYSNDYVELETLSEMSHPAVGEAIEHAVTWRLLPRGERGVDALAAELAVRAADEGTGPGAP